MTRARLLHLRRFLLGACGAAAAWALVVAATGGFLVRVGDMRVSSRDPSAAALVALISGLGLLALRRVPAAHTTLREERAWWAGLLVACAHGARYLLIPSVAIAIVAAGLDIALWLRAAPLWVDEEMIALNFRDRSFADLPGALWLGQSAPLGWLVVQRGVLLTLGTAELSLRLVPLLFGIATVVAAVWIGERWMNRLGAALLVLLCSFGQWLSFFRFELKHYSADAFWALLLPALAAWAIEPTDPGESRRRWTRWWAVAAIGQWFANGALLVTPGCAVVLLVAILRRHGTRAAAQFALTGLVWLASFGAHYELSLQHTHHNSYLRGYWANDVPPESIGIFDTLAWIAARLDALANNPAGTALAVGLWACAICGFAFSAKRMLAAMFAVVPLTAFVLASLRLVPLHERLSLWIVPALYVGVALLADTGLRRGLAAWRLRQWPRLALTAIAAVFALQVSGDIFARGKPDLNFAPRYSNHGVDDRSAVDWLMKRRRPGDALMTTRLGWPAIRWYGPIPLNRSAPRGRLPDGSVMYEVSHERARPDCGTQMRDVLAEHRRVLVHVGFPHMPEGFFELLLQELARFGTVVELHEFAYLSRVAVIDLRDPASWELSVPADPSAGDRQSLNGCVRVGTARRW